MKLWRGFDSTSIYNVALGAPALLVNRGEREDWLNEWRAELWHLVDASRHNNHSSTRVNWEVARFCMGSLNDAIWIRRNSPTPTRGAPCWLRSPIQCLAFLAALAVLTSLLALWHGVVTPPYTTREFMLIQVEGIGIALLILPTITTFGLGEYPATPYSATRTTPIYRWTFFAIKFGLILSIIFFGTLDLAPVIAPAEPDVSLIGYVLAFRWAFIDQRRRCPVCLRVLTNPVRIGQASHIMLDWYGTEFICSKGHGLLHVPATPTSSYGTQRWLQLDSSWRSLFS